MSMDFTKAHVLELFEFEEGVPRFIEIEPDNAVFVFGMEIGRDKKTGKAVMASRPLRLWAYKFGDYLLTVEGEIIDLKELDRLFGRGKS